MTVRLVQRRRAKSKRRRRAAGAGYDHRGTGKAPWRRRLS